MRKNHLLVTVAVVVVMLAGALVMYRAFFIRLVRVPTGAMLNTILIGDQLVVNKSWGELKRGQIVMFQQKNSSENYICRIVGLPRETIQVRGVSVLINNKPLDEQRVFTKPQDVKSVGPLEEVSSDGNGPYRVFYVWRETATERDSASEGGTFGIDAPYHLSDDEYFLMGDNRDNSYDSRYRGPVPNDLIWGTASLIYWSSPIQAETVRWERVLKRIQ